MSNINKLESIEKIFAVQEKRIASELYHCFEGQRRKLEQMEELKRYRSDYLEGRKRISAVQLAMQRVMLMKVEAALHQGVSQLKSLKQKSESLHGQMALLRSKQKAVAKIVAREKQKQLVRMEMDEQLELEGFLLSVAANK